MAQADLWTATNFIWGYNLPDTSMPGIFGIYRNLIINGGLAAVPHPTLYVGKGTFIDRDAVFGGGGVEGAGSTAADAPTFNSYN